MHRGYDADPREIYLIPEVRRFYQAFHRAWPFWLYFCDVNQDGLRAMVFCCLNSLAEIKRDGQAVCGVESDPLELVLFIAKDFPYMNAMCEQAIFERTRQVFEYFFNCLLLSAGRKLKANQDELATYDEAITVARRNQAKTFFWRCY